MSIMDSIFKMKSPNQGGGSVRNFQLKDIADRAKGIFNREVQRGRDNLFKSAESSLSRSVDDAFNRAGAWFRRTPRGMAMEAAATRDKVSEIVMNPLTWLVVVGVLAVAFIAGRRR